MLGVLKRQGEGYSWVSRNKRHLQGGIWAIWDNALQAIGSGVILGLHTSGVRFMLQWALESPRRLLSTRMVGALLGELLRDGDSLGLGDTAVDANESSVGTRGAVEDGARCDSDAVFDSLEDGVEI